MMGRISILGGQLQFESRVDFHARQFAKYKEGDRDGDKSNGGLRWPGLEFESLKIVKYPDIEVVAQWRRWESCLVSIPQTSWPDLNGYSDYQAWMGFDKEVKLSDIKII